MNKLLTELQRLYFLQDPQWHIQQAGGAPFHPEGELTPEIVAESLAGEKSLAFNLVGADGLSRAMVIKFNRPGDWERVANLYQAVQEELDLPAPAVSVSGRQGYRLWFSLAEPLPVAQVRRFLKALSAHYLADIPVADIEFLLGTDMPASTGQGLVQLVPAPNALTGKWSAFIDPSLGSMFIDEPGLEMAPALDKQAGILAGLESIKPVDFQRALEHLQRHDAEQSASAQDKALGQAPTASDCEYPSLNVGKHYSDPKSFLLAVMNDASASPRHRIEAAKALLPYFVEGA